MRNMSVANACIKPTIRAAATAMFMIDRALGKPTEEMAARVENNLAHMNVIDRPRMGLSAVRTPAD